MVKCLVHSDPHCFVVALLDVKRFDGVVKFGATDRSDTLHLCVHVFWPADLAICVTLSRPCQHPPDDGRGHLLL